MATEWEQVYADIEDLLGPGLDLDPWERVLYYHLLRHTRLKGKESGTFAVAPLSNAVPLSDFKVRDVLRSLHRKGCIRIEDRSRNGHLVHVLLPAEVPGLSRPGVQPAPVDIELLDFFTGRRYVEALLLRERDACFYCLRQVAKESCELDHLIPQMKDLNNSYRNIVVTCHGCNKVKRGVSAGDFLRHLYRTGVLNEKELQQRLSAVETVQAGLMVPEV